MSVIDMAKELGKAISESEEIEVLRQYKNEVEKHEAAKIMLRDVRAFQELFDKKRLNGEEISEEDTERFKRVYEMAQMNPYVRDLLMAEAKAFAMINEVWHCISEAVNASLKN